MPVFDAQRLIGDLARPAGALGDEDVLCGHLPREFVDKYMRVDVFAPLAHLLCDRGVFLPHPHAVVLPQGAFLCAPGIFLGGERRERLFQIGGEAYGDLHVEFIDLGRVDVDDDFLRVFCKIPVIPRGETAVKAAAEYEQNIGVLEDKVRRAMPHAAGAAEVQGIVMI